MEVTACCGLFTLPNPNSDSMILTVHEMATLYYVGLFTLHTVGFRFVSQLPSKGMELNTGSESFNVNKPLRPNKYIPLNGSQ